MDTLLAITLVWAFVVVAMALFGIACIKFGAYTSGNHNSRATLET